MLVIINELLSVGGFVGLSFLITKDVKVSIGLGIILYIFNNKNNNRDKI